MANYDAQSAGSTGTTLTTRTGTASADAVRAGALVIIQNTGAGTHVIAANLTGYFVDGNLQVPNRSVSVAAGAFAAWRVPAAYDVDGDGYVPITIDATAAEVKYWVVV